MLSYFTYGCLADAPIDTNCLDEIYSSSRLPKLLKVSRRSQAASRRPFSIDWSAVFGANALVASGVTRPACTVDCDTGCRGEFLRGASCMWFRGLFRLSRIFDWLSTRGDFDVQDLGAGFGALQFLSATIGRGDPSVFGHTRSGLARALRDGRRPKITLTALKRFGPVVKAWLPFPSGSAISRSPWAIKNVPAQVRICRQGRCLGCQPVTLANSAASRTSSSLAHRVSQASTSP